MSLVAILLVLAAAVSHAGWNLCAKRVPQGGAVFVWLYALASAVLMVPVAVITVLVADWTPTPAWLLALGVSGVLHLGYFLLLQRGYATGDLSVVYPLARGTGPLLTVVIAVLLLGERPHPLALAGAGAVVAGVFVIGAGRRNDAERRSHLAGAVYGVLTGALIAGYTLWDARAVTAAAVPPLVLMTGSVLVEAVLLTPVAMLHRDRAAALWRDHRREVLVVAVLSPLAYLLVLFALRHAPVSLVAPARELSIVLASLAAWLLLGEPNPLRRLIGAGIVLAGVAAIAMA